MANYILSTDDTAKSFTFKIGELEYEFRYPTTKELREIGALNDDIKKLVDEKASDKEITAKGKESEDKMNTLVTPVGHENPIGEVLETVGINVVRSFRAMMAKEITLE
jgi:hypothetical protein